MEWEKQYYVRICEAMELLQFEVMNTRPSLALGMVARSLIMLSVPTSMVVIMFHLVEVAKGILEAGITDP